ncbi:DUF6882 domain-containing protein [Trichocoleus sp. FACHB-262]|uniref:DUF6882 domain-containing protein n=1 Tax=Trichocoleus sp. FACHB-262 TaxID=2692869 RepID=UPI001687B43D|nr:DUF6882 domain-containing protein [Trichocoleus sp. FACHB-262]MBD2119948.1 hypothetical protein [Trichocoleus sp. FACHB-262]
MVTTFAELLLAHGAAAFDQQLCLSELLGEHTWWFDMEAGTLEFNETLTFPVQILGSESDSSQTWLWSWANAESHIPEQFLQDALELAAFGDRAAIAELKQPQLSLSDEINGHALSMVASGLCQANAYYCAPYAGGALFVLLKQADYRWPIDDPIARIAFVFPQFISTFSLSNHRQAFACYLGFYNLEVSEQENYVLGRFNGDRAITAKFDQNQRLIELTASD